MLFKNNYTDITGLIVNVQELFYECNISLGNDDWSLDLGGYYFLILYLLSK